MTDLNEKFLEEAQKFVSEDDAREAYMRCAENRDHPIIADEVHIVEFAEHLISMIGPKIAKAELDACINVVQALNPEVARKLKEVRERP